MLDDDIVRDLLNDLIGEIPESQENATREELKAVLGEIGTKSGNDFETLVLCLVEFRRSRVVNPPQLVRFP